MTRRTRSARLVGYIPGEALARATDEQLDSIAEALGAALWAESQRQREEWIRANPGKQPED